MKEGQGSLSLLTLLYLLCCVKSITALESTQVQIPELNKPQVCNEQTGFKKKKVKPGKIIEVPLQTLQSS